VKTRTLSLIVLGSLLIGAVVFVAVAIGYYRSIFAGNLSTQANDWIVFGTFIGGILGPCLSFFALIALLYTLTIQGGQLQAMKESLNASNEQIEVMQKTLAVSQTQAHIIELQNVLSNFLHEVQSLLPFFNNEYDIAMKKEQQEREAYAGNDETILKMSDFIERSAYFLQKLKEYDHESYYAEYVKELLWDPARKLYELQVLSAEVISPIVIIGVIRWQRPRHEN